MSKTIDFVITRTFEAPRELVFQAFTQAEHLQHWWGPKGMKLGVSELDVRPGGVFLYSMESADGYKMWGKIVYREIMAPEKIVFTTSFADEEGNIIRAPFSQTWPLEVLSTWTFTEEDGKTTISLHSIPFNATEEEQQTFAAMHSSMEQGFGGTFDQLVDYLAQM